MASSPLLRAPPFPWVAAGAAAVAFHRDADDPGSEPAAARIDALAASLARARVGGSFWAPPLDPVATLLRPRSAAEAAAMAGLVEPGRPALALLPDARWARAVRRAFGARGIAVRIGEVDPWSLLAPGTQVVAHADDAYALLGHVAGARVVGAGGQPIPPETLRRRLAHALCRATRYREPFDGRAIEAEEAIELLALWRERLDANRAIGVAIGMAWWKRAAIARFLWVDRARPLRFVRSASAAIRVARREGSAIAAWPSRVPASLPARAAAAGVALARVEDGFLRSAGLGSDLVPPLSIVVDEEGVYYDPARPSRLETILATAAFPPDLLERARAIASFVLRERIGKYGGASGHVAAPPKAKRRVLVAGQVEDDLSVRLGGGGVAGNLDLLVRARRAEPEAELWFRPHPDVDAGHRRGAIADAEALRHADRVVRGGAMAGLLEEVDGVHVLTSLTGFEALLRGRDVTVHGSPFYAGWGLTRDLAPAIARRTRRLTLDELVAGALILYPRYLDPVTQLPCTPEILVARLARPGIARATWLTRIRRVQGRARRVMGQGFA